MKITTLNSNVVDNNFIIAQQHSPTADFFTLLPDEGDNLYLSKNTTVMTNLKKIYQQNNPPFIKQASVTSDVYNSITIEHYDNNGLKWLVTTAKQHYDNSTSIIKLAISEAETNEIISFLKTQYKRYFSQITFNESKHYINNSFNFYTRDQHGKINSTASLQIDSADGFAEEHVLKDDIQPYRDKGLKCLEIGRFVIDENHQKKLAKHYFKTFYLFSKQLGYDIVLGMIKQKDVKIHQRFGAKVFNHNTGLHFGSEHTFASAAWELNNMEPRFYQWIGVTK